MEIKRIIKKNKDQYQLILSDNTSLSIYDDTIIRYNLLSKRSLTPELIKEIMEYNNEAESYYKAINFIKYKLRTKKEIESKLRSLGYSKKIIDNTIKKLEQQMYINDDMYILAYVNDQINLTLKGPMKIKNELEKKGFDVSKISVKLDDLDNSMWFDRCKKVMNKRIKANRNYSKRQLQLKIKEELLNLGYDINLVNEVVDIMDYEDDDSILKKEINKAYKKYSKKYSKELLEMKIKAHLYNKGFSSDIDIFDYLK